MAEMNDWNSTQKNVTSIDITGRERSLSVPVFVHKRRATRMVFIDDLIKAEQQQLAAEKGIGAIDMNNLLLLYADSRYFEGRRKIRKTYIFNKMVFYLEKELQKTSFRDSYMHDEFWSARAGPVPKSLKDSIRRMEAKGLVKVKWSHRHDESSEFELTERGTEVAADLWHKMPEEVRLVFRKVKQDLSLISAEELKNKVHKEYPEYKRTYTDLDDEA